MTVSRQGHPRIALRQRGATTVFAAVALLAGLTATLLAVEVGRMYTAHRDLQRLASMAAMDAVRVVGGCDRSSPPSASEVNSGVRVSLARQGADAESLLGTGSSVEIGTWRTQDDLRQLEPGDPAEAYAVGVALSQPFPQPLLGLMPYDDSRRMLVRAHATQDVVGGISVGTSLLTLDSSQSDLLNQLFSGYLGGSVNLSLLSWQGLLGADVTLAELAAAAGVATPGDLLALELSLGDALGLLGDALGNSSDPAEAALLSALDELAAVVDPGRDSVLLGDVLVVEEGVEDLVGQLPINSVQLLSALSEAAVQGYAFSVPLSVSIPGIASVGLQMRVGQGRQIALGRAGFREDGTARTRAHSSQIQLQLDVSVLDILNTLPVVGGVLDLSVVAEVAPATATLREVHCAYSGRSYHVADVDIETGLASVAIGRYNSLNAATPQILPLGQVLNVAGLLRININDVIRIELDDDSGMEEFEGPFVPTVSELDPDRHLRTVGMGVTDALDGVVVDLLQDTAQEITFSGLLGTPLNLLSDAQVQALITPLLSPLWLALDTVLADLLQLTGVELATATVAVESLQAKQPVLFAQN